MNGIGNTTAIASLHPASQGRAGVARTAAGATPAATGRGGEAAQGKEAETLRKLQARDQQVRAHEQAHLAAAGSYATSGTNFTYQRGPDGVMYAVGGEVSIDTSPVAGDPQATLRKAQTIIRAAMAPAEPSSQDRQVAAAARQMAIKAQAELANGQSGGSPSAPDTGNRLQQRINAAGGGETGTASGLISLYA